MYDKACYERRKNRIIKKLTSEEFTAYATIKGKWWFDDFTIRDLLRNHTVSEILAGELKEWSFTPKELFYLDCLRTEFSKQCGNCKYGNMCEHAVRIGKIPQYPG